MTFDIQAIRTHWVRQVFGGAADSARKGRAPASAAAPSAGRRGVEGPTALLQATLESMDHGCLVVGPDLEIVGCNERVADILNVPREMLGLGRSFADIIALAAERGDYGPGDPEELRRSRIASATSGESHLFDRHQPDGTVLSARARPMPDGGMVITYTDITELRRLETRLRESEERYSLAIAGAQSGIWDWDIPAGRVDFSPRYAEILGIPLEEIRDTPDWWPRRIHPDDREIFTSAMHAHIKGETEVYEAEYRVGTADGEWIWIGDRGMALRDEKTGRAYRIAGSVENITDRKEAEAALQKMATTDPLTGACNRRRFIESAETELYRADRYGGSLSIALFDIDHFKRVNDTWGHAEGDRCLVSFVALVQSLVRRTDLLARFGGEEFALMMTETDLEPARILCERIREKVETVLPRQGPPAIRFTVSAGLAAFRPGATLDAMLGRADEALYEAKSAGRNRVMPAVVRERAPSGARAACRDTSRPGAGASLDGA